MMKRFGGMFLLSGFLWASTLHAADLYVDSASPRSVPPYISWEFAAHSIQAAVSRAADGDTVWVNGSNGTKVYTGANYDSSTRTTNVVIMNSNVTVVGVGNPIIDGQLEVRGVLMNKGQLRGFTVRNGAYGGIACYGGDIFDCSIENNTSRSGGGGIYCNPESIHTESVISNCNFANNVSSNSGGGLYANGAKVRVVNCQFTWNLVTHELNLPAAGGGVRMIGGVLIGCAISNNMAKGGNGAWGGGVYLEGSAIASNCVIVDNRADVYTSALGASGGGAAVFSADMWNCTLTNNFSYSDGGGAYVGLNGRVYNCLFKKNASYNLDSVSIQNGYLFNSTVVGYGTGRGIMIHNQGGEVDNCIVVSNGVSCEAANGANVTFYNNCTLPAYAGPITTGGGNISVHPLFVNYATGDYRLQAGSPCINAGLDQAWMTGAKDLAGNPRAVGAHVDMGAYEAQTAGSWDSGYTDIGGGWRRLTWFGDYVPMGGAGWIWHNKHGFLYPTPASTPADIWFYANDMGWLWTSNTTYPFLYRSSPAAWLWYNGATNPRWFRNMTANTWESRP